MADSNWKHLLPAYLAIAFAVGGGIFQYGTLSQTANNNTEAIEKAITLGQDGQTAIVQRMDRLESDVRRAEDKADYAQLLASSNTTRLDKMETALAAIHTIQVDMATMTATQSSIREDVSEMKEEMRDLKK